MKRYLILIAVFGFLAIQSTKAQAIFLKRNPKVEVKIRLISDVYTNTDSMKLLVTITNHQDTAQKVLFGGRPWGMSALVNDKAGKSVTEYPCRCVFDSQLYFESEEEKKGSFKFLKPNDSLAFDYYLRSIMVFNFKNYNQIRPGTYKLRLYYFGNSSNEVSFEIKK